MIDPQASDRKLLNVARAATIVSGVLAAAMACLYRDIVDILEFVYDFWAPTMITPFLVGLFCFRRRWSQAITLAMVAGFLAVVVWRFILLVPGDFSSGLFGFLVSLAVFLIAAVAVERSTNSETPAVEEESAS